LRYFPAKINNRRNRRFSQNRRKKWFPSKDTESIKAKYCFRELPIFVEISISISVSKNSKNIAVYRNFQITNGTLRT
jgi:hypothetical protein